ncbi:MAG: ATP-binding protein [Actinomycetota bacterium]
MHHDHHHGEGGVYFLSRQPRVTWDDIGGFADLKETVKEMISLPLKNPDLISEMKIDPPAGVLMWGPLGTGLKMLAEASAAEAGAHYIYVSGQEMLGKPEELKKAFAEAVKQAPTVLFISDVEWLAPRAGADYEWEKGNLRGIPPTFADKGLTTVFIKEVDKLQDGGDVSPFKKGVALVGSCYRIDVVDQALVKEKSRFNRKVFIHPPTEKDREGILRIYIERLKPNLGGEMDYRLLAQKTEGYVGWDLENLCKRAALNAVKAGSDKIEIGHFLTAVGEIQPWLTPGMQKKYYELRELDCSHYYTF